MKRTISSAAHSAFKMLMLFFSFLFVLMFIVSSIDSGRIRWDRVLFPGGVLALFLWFAISRKTIQMDDHFLYASVFRRVAVIPLEQISSVRESIGMRDRSVTIHFHNTTPFGRSITFSPTYKLTGKPHPIVTELSAYAHAPTNAPYEH
ncbi:MAG: hypothetical protein ABIT76_15625 [Chthoniobacterales bacterium]